MNLDDLFGPEDLSDAVARLDPAGVEAVVRAQIAHALSALVGGSGHLGSLVPERLVVEDAGPASDGRAWRFTGEASVLTEHLDDRGRQALDGVLILGPDLSFRYADDGTLRLTPYRSALCDVRWGPAARRLLR